MGETADPFDGRSPFDGSEWNERVEPRAFDFPFGPRCYALGQAVRFTLETNPPVEPHEVTGQLSERGNAPIPVELQRDERGVYFYDYDLVAPSEPGMYSVTFYARGKAAWNTVVIEPPQP